MKKRILIVQPIGVAVVSGLYLGFHDRERFLAKIKAHPAPLADKRNKR